MCQCNNLFNNMNVSNSKSYFKNLLIINVRLFFEEIKDHFAYNKKWENEILLKEASFNSIELEKRKDIIDPNLFSIQFNKIIISLLEIIDEMTFKDSEKINIEKVQLTSEINVEQGLQTLYTKVVDEYLSYYDWTLNLFFNQIISEHTNEAASGFEKVSNIIQSDKELFKRLSFVADFKEFINSTGSAIQSFQAKSKVYEEKFSSLDLIYKKKIISELAMFNKDKAEVIIRIHEKESFHGSESYESKMEKINRSSIEVGKFYIDFLSKINEYLSSKLYKLQ